MLQEGKNFAQAELKLEGLDLQTLGCREEPLLNSKKSLLSNLVQKVTASVAKDDAKKVKANHPGASSQEVLIRRGVRIVQGRHDKRDLEWEQKEAEVRPGAADESGDELGPGRTRRDRLGQQVHKRSLTAGPNPGPRDHPASIDASPPPPPPRPPSWSPTVGGIRFPRRRAALQLAIRFPALPM